MARPLPKIVIRCMTGRISARQLDAAIVQQVRQEARENRHVGNGQIGREYGLDLSHRHMFMDVERQQHGGANGKCCREEAQRVQDRTLA